jgi:hypothetical protein
MVLLVPGCRPRCRHHCRQLPAGLGLGRLPWYALCADEAPRLGGAVSGGRRPSRTQHRDRGESTTGDLMTEAR